MAPQSTRRSGFSRRAQYTTFFAYIAGAAGILVGGIFLVSSIRQPQAYASLRGAAADASVPAARLAAKGRTESRGLVETLAGYFQSGAENARLRREVEITRVKLVEAQAQAGENKRLKALLGLREEEPRPVAMARMIGSTSASTRRFATISAGAAEGVEVGMPVRSPLGLVGRVLETGAHSARILLVTDTESVVPVRRASDGLAAFASGKADGTLQVRLITLGINPLKQGDAFVTSGSGGLYPPGVAIAVATQITRDGAIARVLSDPAATDFVAVEPVWNAPAVPAPAAPATTLPSRGHARP